MINIYGEFECDTCQSNIQERNYFIITLNREYCFRCGKTKLGEMPSAKLCRMGDK